MEVEIREYRHQKSGTTKSAAGIFPNALQSNYNDSSVPQSTADPPVIIVRFEEVLLVVLVLVLWVAAIALFFNRWGKIRMLEPYQPKFNQAQHRPSCPLVPLTPPGIPATQRMSFSKYNVNALTDPLSILPSPIIRRPRQNSVFVGSSSPMTSTTPPQPRRAKSATDLHRLVINEGLPTSFSVISNHRRGTLIPIVLGRDRRQSITPDRQTLLPLNSRILPPPSSYLQSQRVRRSSCFPPRTQFSSSSSQGPNKLNHHRKMSLATERPTCSRYLTAPAFNVGGATSAPMRRLGTTQQFIPPKKLSKSFEHPPTQEKPHTERMATSFDVTLVDTGRYSSVSGQLDEEKEESPTMSSVVICLDEDRIDAPLLENLKSSDV